MVVSTVRRVAGGVTPPGPRRTVREPLGSPGSHHPALRPHAQPPMREQPRLASGDLRQEPSGPPALVAQPLVLPHGPANKDLVAVPDGGMQRGLVEPPVVADPPLLTVLNIRARPVRVLSDRRCSRQRRISRRIRVPAWLLTAGVQPTKRLPARLRTSRGRNV